MGRRAHLLCQQGYNSVELTPEMAVLGPPVGELTLGPTAGEVSEVLYLALDRGACNPELGGDRIVGVIQRDQREECGAVGCDARQTGRASADTTMAEQSVPPTRGAGNH